MKKYMPKIYSTMLILLIILTSFGYTAAETVYTHRQTGIIFPSEIALLKFDKTTDYEKNNRGMGIGLSYRSEQGFKADIYLYNLGVKDIPNGISSKIVKKAHEDALREISASGTVGAYKNVSKLYDTIASNFSIPFLSAKFSYLDLLLPESKRVQCISYTYVTGYSGYILKVRYTYLNDLPQYSQQLEDIHNYFMNSFMKLLN